MAKYVSKQVEIDAFQVIASIESGPLQCSKGDWIVQLPSGTIIVMGDGEFKRQYELKQDGPKQPLIRSAVQPPVLKPDVDKAWPKEWSGCSACNASGQRACRHCNVCGKWNCGRQH